MSIGHDGSRPPNLGKSEYRELVHDDSLRGVTNELPADFFESPPAVDDPHSSRLRHCLSLGVRSSRRALAG
jgi:hypothetical protein